MNSTIKLQTESILHVPFNNYQKDFLFLINNEEFATTKFIADILSPKISKYHKIDPTINLYSLTTNSKGNFQNILDLLDFNLRCIDEEEIPFIIEIFENLEIDKIDIQINTPEISINNVIHQIKEHEKAKFFYSKKLTAEIDFLSSHFYELKEDQVNDLLEMNTDTIENVIRNKNLKLESEDQLLNFINHLYSKNDRFAYLFECICFQNISCEMMKLFVSDFDYEQMTRTMWESISKRLIQKVVHSNEVMQYGRYKSKKFIPSENDLRGIFSYLKNESDIKNEVDATFSSKDKGDVYLLLDIENSSNEFYTSNSPNSWICFEFKNHKIIPSGYTIRSYKNKANQYHLKDWIIEGSIDKKNWTKIDERKDCSFLNGSNFVHTFSISEKREFTQCFNFIRIHQTGTNWSNDNYLEFSSIEFYGELI